MSYDDPFDPTLPNDYDDDDDYIMSHEIAAMGDQYVRNIDDESFAGTSSIGSLTKKQRKLYEDSKKLDKGYGKIFIRSNHRRIPVEYYSTNDNPGSTIRNAITGIYETGNRFGKKEEDLFFKTSISSGSHKHFLFYDNPEEFERHFFCTVPEESKLKWEAKTLNARTQRVLESELKEERGNVTIR
jgi:hypothetical protein